MSEYLDAIKARADAATPGPWETCCFDSGHSRFEMSCSVITPDVGDTIVDFDALKRLDNERHAQDDGYRDAAFIAHARTDVPALHGALVAVLALHRPNHDWDCAPAICVAEIEPWPCPTVRAITEALEADR
jgi:hypothetical protein